MIKKYCGIIVVCGGSIFVYFVGYPIFTSQGIVISYLYSINWQKLGFYLIGSTGIIWNQLQTISHCENKTCSYLKWKVKIVYPLISDWKDRSDWLADNNNLTPRASSSPTFKRLLLSRDFVEIQYHNTLTCEDEVTLTHEFMTPRMYNKVPINDLSYIIITTNQSATKLCPNKPAQFL